MQYTLWSRGRLLGETDLGFIYREHGFRCGWFHPNALGERLMAAASGIAPAMRIEFSIGPDAEAHADVLAAIDRKEALELELRGPNGSPIDTEDIAIIDTHYLLSIGNDAEEEKRLEEELTAEEEAEVQEMLAEWESEHPAWTQGLEPEEETEFPRYQIQVQLVDELSVP